MLLEDDTPSCLLKVVIVEPIVVVEAMLYTLIVNRLGHRSDDLHHFHRDRHGVEMPEFFEDVDHQRIDFQFGVFTILDFLQDHGKYIAIIDWHHTQYHTFECLLVPCVPRVDADHHVLRQRRVVG